MPYKNPNQPYGGSKVCEGLDCQNLIQPTISWKDKRYCSNGCVHRGKSSWNKGVPNTWYNPAGLELGRGWNKGLTKETDPRLDYDNPTKIKKGERIGIDTEFKKGNPPPAHRLDCECFRCSPSSENSHGYIDGRSKLPGYKSLKVHIRRTRMAQNGGGNYTLQEWEALKKEHDYICLYCKQKEPIITLTVDHIVPITKGGVNDISNIQPLCKSCNSRKGVQIISYIGNENKVKV